jgi:hypothetical protein
MMSPKSVKLIAILAGVSITAVMGLLFSIPGLLLGAITGLFTGLFLVERLEGMRPENRRRRRRMLRNEGLG